MHVPACYYHYLTLHPEISHLCKLNANWSLIKVHLRFPFNSLGANEIKTTVKWIILQKRTNLLFSAMKIHFLQEITLRELMKATLSHFKHHHFHLGCLSGCASVRYTYQQPKCSKINGSNQQLRTVNSQA